MNGETDCDLSIVTSGIPDEQYLAGMTVLLEEWSSGADAEAYDEL